MKSILCVSLVLLSLLAVFTVPSHSKTIAVKLSAGVSKTQLSAFSKQGSNRVQDVFPGSAVDSPLERWVFVDDSNVDVSRLLTSGTITTIDTLPVRKTQVIHGVIPGEPSVPNTSNRIATVGNADPYRYLQWQLDRIYADAAWNTTSGSNDVIVAVVDVGTDITHPDLLNQIAINQTERLGMTGVDDDHNGFIDDIHGWNFIDNNDDPTPPTASELHGTHVAGIILAAQNGQFGVGVAPNVKLLAVRSGAGETIAYGYEGIYYATIRGAKIINCSWGGSFMSAAEADVVQYAISNGVTIFAAAGNYSPATPIDSMLFPAALPGVISVGATTRNDVPASYSNRNITVSIWAPGTQIPSTFPRNNFGVISGTSMASPCAAGVGALVQSVLPNATSQEIRTILISSGDQIVDVLANHPTIRVNAYRAVQEAIRHQGTTTERWTGSEQPGSTIQLTIPVQLNVANNEQLTLYGTQLNGASWSTSIAPMASSQNGTVRTGILGLTLPNSIIRGSTVIAGWRVTGSGFTRYYGTSIHRISPPEATLEDSQMKMTFSGIGAIGLYDPYSPIPVGVSLQSPPETPGVVFHGSFLLSTGANVVMDNIFGDDANSGFDWEVPLSQPVTVTGTPPQQLQTTAMLVPSHSTFPVQVEWTAQMVIQSATVPAVDIVGRIRNTTVSNLSNLIAGWMIDFDVGNSGNDVGTADTSLRLLTMGDASLTNRYGVFVKNGTISVAHLIRASDISGSSWNDLQKYYDISWTGSDGAQNHPDDYAMLFATPQFNLTGNGYYDFGFRIFLASSQQQAEQLATQWRGSSSFASGTKQEHTNFEVTSFGSTVRINSNSVGLEKLNMYNVLGQLVRTQNMNGQQTGMLSLTGLPHGTYFISGITSTGALPAKKVVYLQ